ncbi:MAG: SMI1/KNR4 family protein [Bacillus sp. (in: firmicutes)]
MKNNLWQDDDYYRQAPLTDEAVAMAEEIFGVKLPEAYIAILKEQNGGYINYDSFPSSVSTSWAEDHVNVDHIFGIAKGSGIMETPYYIQEWELPENIILLSGDGHSWIALDYRNQKADPPVIYVDAESEQIIELAPDFNIFLDGLYVREMEDGGDVC